MSVPQPHSLENLLRHIAEATPEPWYPSAFARAAGLPRDSLDQPLERLRLAGLVRLTDWVADRGQGYVLTPDGAEVLKSPHALIQLGNGFLPPRREAATPTFRLPERGSSEWERGEEVRDALLRPMDPLVTKVLLAANILWFLGGLALALSAGMPANQYLTASGPGFERIVLQEGALTGDAFLNGQWWRLLTCCFVHFGFIHLAVNMYSLYVIGPLTERMWGRWRFLVIYLIAGFGGSCAMLWKNPMTLGAGASGALWGIMASFGVWVLLNKRYLPPPLTSSWLRSLVIVLVINVGISIAPDLNISASAHFGGGIVGVLASLLAHSQRYGSVPRRWLSLLGLVLLPLGALGVLVWTMNTNPAWTEVRVEGAARRLDSARLRLREALEHTLNVYDRQVKPVLVAPPRDVAAVEKAQAALRDQRAELAEVQKYLEEAGPFAEPELEKRRHGFLQVTASAVEMCDVADKALPDGPDWQERAAAVDEFAEQLRKLLKR